MFGIKIIYNQAALVNEPMKKSVRSILTFLVLFTLFFGVLPPKVFSQTPMVWSNFQNISRTPTSSSYPAMVADRFGQVHVVWSEAVGGKTSNLVFNLDGTPRLDQRGRQVNYLTDRGNTIFYTRWNGEKWTQPIDIQTSLTGNLANSDIAVDVEGTVHLIWTSATNERADLLYSQAPGHSADSVHAWTKPEILASNLITTYYPVGITADLSNGLYIIYYQIGVNPGVYVIRSFDEGMSWSDPTQLFANESSTGNEDGSLPVRILSDKKGRIHAAWTVYAQDGNGKSIYYAQSLDKGETWSRPYSLATKQPGWYEVDWLNIGVVGDQIHAVWEGGPISYNNERISEDGGLTWGTARRIMPKLVGENGWADLVTDSQGILHQIIVKRISAGTQIVYALWHSEFQDQQWITPVIIGLQDENFYNDSDNLSKEAIKSLLAGTIMDDGLRYQRSVVLGGNELFVIVVNEYDGEIYFSRKVVDAPHIPPEPFPTIAPPTPAETASLVLPTVEPTPSVPFERNVEDSSLNPGTLVVASMIPVILLVLGLIIYSRIAHHK